MLLFLFEPQHGTSSEDESDSYMVQLTPMRPRDHILATAAGVHVLFAWRTYLLLTEFEGRTVSYGPSFFLLDLWPKREARGP